MSNRINNVHGWFRRLPRNIKEFFLDFKDDKPVTFWTLVVLVVAGGVCSVIWPMVGIWILGILGSMAAVIFFIWWLFNIFEEIFG